MGLLFRAYEHGDDALHAMVQALKIREDWMWIPFPKGWKSGDPVPPEATQYPPPRPANCR